MSITQIKAAQLQNLKIDPEVKKDKKLEEASKKLESVFLNLVLKAMEKTIPRDKESGSNNLARMMFSSVMGDAIAKQGGIGLADFVYKSMVDNDGENPLEKLKNDVNLDALYHIKSLGAHDE